MAGATLKGSLISFQSSGGAFGLPALPNVITFQINPETITHTWTEAVAPQADPDAKVKFSPLAVTGVPGESFAFTLMLDSDQQIADGGSDPIGAGLATVSGVYTRLAALELLQFPSSGDGAGGLVGAVSSALSAAGIGASAASSTSKDVPESQVPVVLFVWGPQRIVPVRVTAFSVTEKLFDVALNPIRAEAQITLTVMTPDELKAVQGPMASIASTAYSYTQNLRATQAQLNLAEAASNVIGMLPLPL